MDTVTTDAVYHHHDSNIGGFDFQSSGGIDDCAVDDFDYTVDCGDFLF